MFICRLRILAPSAQWRGQSCSLVRGKAASGCSSGSLNSRACKRLLTAPSTYIQQRPSASHTWSGTVGRLCTHNASCAGRSAPCLKPADPNTATSPRVYRVLCWSQSIPFCCVRARNMLPGTLFRQFESHRHDHVTERLLRSDVQNILRRLLTDQRETFIHSVDTNIDNLTTRTRALSAQFSTYVLIRVPLASIAPVCVMSECLCVHGSASSVIKPFLLLYKRSGVCVCVYVCACVCWGLSYAMCL